MSRGRLLLSVWAFLVFGLAVRALAMGFLRSADPAHALEVRPVRVDLNRATVAELQVLPGVGQARAEAIVLHRVRRGWYRRLEDLDGVDGVGGATIELLRPYVELAVHAPARGS